MGLGPGGGGRGAGARSKAVAVALVALDLSLRARVDRVGRGGGSQRGVLGRRVSSGGAKAEGGKEINGRGGGPGTRARGGRVARMPTRTPPTPRVEPSTRSVGLVERGDAPGSRWRRPPSPPLSSGGCCRTAWAPPHPRCRRMSTTRRCPDRVAGCATRTCCSRGSSRAGRGFLCAACSTANVARRRFEREFQEIYFQVVTSTRFFDQVAAHGSGGVGRRLSDLARIEPCRENMSVSMVSLAAPPHRSVASFAPPSLTRALSGAMLTKSARSRPRE